MDSRLLSELLQDDDYVSVDGEYNVPLGMKEDGSVVTWGMDAIPHILIGGTTGCGKTNLVKSILLALASYLDKDKFQFAVVDTKGVDYQPFSSLPQALVPVITDMTKARGLISWAAYESDRRLQSAARKEAPPSHLFLVLDDFALAQLSRAAIETLLNVMRNGRTSRIHCILVSSSTSAEGVPAAVRANAPCRICFYVPAAANSRLVLNISGAEKLAFPGEAIGLFQNDIAKCMTPLLTDADEAHLIKAIHARLGERPVDIEVELTGGSSAAASGGENEPDLSFDTAVEVVLETGQASTALLQRRLKVGYSNAARLLDQMEERGIAGPFEGSKPRQLLITRAQWQELKAKRAGGAGNTMSRGEEHSPQNTVAQVSAESVKKVTPFAMELSGRRWVQVEGDEFLIELPVPDRVLRASVRVQLDKIKAVEMKLPTPHETGAVYLVLPDDFTWEGDMSLLEQLVDENGDIRLPVEGIERVSLEQAALRMAEELQIPHRFRAGNGVRRR